MQNKEGDGTQKVQKGPKIEMSCRPIAIHCQKFRCSMLNIWWFRDQKHAFELL